MNVHEFSPMASSFDLLHAVSRSFQSTCVYFCLSYPEKGVILEIPALPVTKGSNLTLRCRLSTGETVAAYFFYSGRLLGPRNKEHTISNVQQSNKGVYWCATDLAGPSPQSFLKIRGWYTDIISYHCGYIVKKLPVLHFPKHFHLMESIMRWRKGVVTKNWGRVESYI